MNKTQNIIELQKKLDKLSDSEFNSWEMGIYDQGEWVINPFSGVKYYLNHIELSVYDLTMGAERMGQTEIVGLCKDWFIENNIKAYMALLD